MTVEDAVSAQFAAAIPQIAKPIFERFRRTRHLAQYFDPEAAELDEDDVEWALTTSGFAVEGAQSLAVRGAVGLFRST